MDKVQFIQICFKFLFTKHYFFKGIAIACSFYLLYTEFILYFEKPTSISIEKRKVQDVFPLVTICPDIGHNQKEMYASGYLTLYDYFAGIISLDNTTGILKYIFFLKVTKS